MPGVVQRLLSCEILTETSGAVIIDKETEVQIGQPAKYATDIINSLTILFANNSRLNAAYLG